MAVRYTEQQSWDAFWSMVDASGDCWIWTGSVASNGYGVLRRQGRNVRAHRMAWTLLVGEVEDGLDLDHLCRNRQCVNPDHLEPVTRQENIRRGTLGKKTACAQGHLFTPENTGWYEWKGGKYDGRMYRRCKQCNRENARRQKAKKAA